MTVGTTVDQNWALGWGSQTLTGGKRKSKFQYIILIGI